MSDARSNTKPINMTKIQKCVETNSLPLRLYHLTLKVKSNNNISTCSVCQSPVMSTFFFFKKTLIIMIPLPLHLKFPQTTPSLFAGLPFDQFSDQSFRHSTQRKTNEKKYFLSNIKKPAMSAFLSKFCGHS